MVIGHWSLDKTRSVGATRQHLVVRDWHLDQSVLLRAVRQYCGDRTYSIKVLFFGEHQQANEDRYEYTVYGRIGRIGWRRGRKCRITFDLRRVIPPQRPPEFMPSASVSYIYYGFDSTSAVPYSGVVSHVLCGII
jgi:hypothetical protein